MKKIMATLLALSTLFVAQSFADSIAANEKVEKQVASVGVQNPKATHLFVVGDSTASPFNDPYFYPRYGFATKFSDFLTPKIEVVNLALSGRSSKSFLTEGNYQILKDNIKKGDYLLIAFGHNDEKTEKARYTNPNGTKEEAGSFKNTLYENYIKLAQDKKATVVLCTPIVRRSPGKAYEGAVVHITKDVEGFPGGDYPKAIRELASETGCLLVDNTAKTKELYEKIGDAETLKLHAWTGHKESNVDNTHLNTYGASRIAYMVITDLASKDKKFAKFVKKGIQEPTVDMLVKNPDYVIPAYEVPTEKSPNFATTDPWWGTVFGDCGGAEKISNPEIYEIKENGTTVLMHSGNKEVAAGKIASASDGIAFYFQRLPANKDFTLSATANIQFIKSNGQVSFGLMVRDDVYMDKFDASIKSNYVAAAPLKITLGEGKYTSCFARIDGALNENPTTAKQSLPADGQTVPLTLSKKGDTVTVQYGKDAPVSYKINLGEVDKDNIYVGLFTSRQVIVEFTNISLK